MKQVLFFLVFFGVFSASSVQASGKFDGMSEKQKAALIKASQAYLKCPTYVNSENSYRRACLQGVYRAVGPLFKAFYPETRVHEKLKEVFQCRFHANLDAQPVNTECVQKVAKEARDLLEKEFDK